MNAVDPLPVASDRCLVIAEIAQAHDGSLGIAHSFIDMAADAGVDAIKFQTHVASAESTRDESWRVNFSYEDASRFEYWRRMEFTMAEWVGLRDHCQSRRVCFLSSPFSLAALRMLREVGVSAWKVASGEGLSLQLVREMCGDGLPILVSTGMSSMVEIDAVVQCCAQEGVKPVLLQCTSMYPTPAEAVGLNVLPELADRHECLIGLSDHSGTVFSGLAAAALGASVLEVHVAFSRQMFGPDSAVSLEPDELRQLTRGVRFLEVARSSPVDKDRMASQLQEIRTLFGKSLVSTSPLPAGTVLEAVHLTAKKPASGIPAAERERLMGRLLRRSVPADHFFEEADFA
jgi:N,N'-diacetyllegionaminate synthase